MVCVIKYSLLMGLSGLKVCRSVNSFYKEKKYFQDSNQDAKDVFGGIKGSSSLFSLTLFNPFLKQLVLLLSTSFGNKLELSLSISTPATQHRALCMLQGWGEGPASILMMALPKQLSESYSKNRRRLDVLCSMLKLQCGTIFYCSVLRPRTKITKRNGILHWRAEELSERQHKNKSFFHF